MKVGVVGIGRMGAAIAARLMEVGHEVTVWNRSADKTKPLADAGAKVAATPAALAGAVETVLTILTDTNAVEQVYSGKDGLLSADVKGKLFIEMSTVPPATNKASAEKTRAKGGVFVECPVGGTIGPARQGKLLGLMGAEPADAARAKPLLDQLCRRVEHVGPVGAGALTKLAVNLPLMVAWQAYGEAFALCRDVGMDPAKLLDLFSDTSGANNALKGRAPMIVAAFENKDTGPVTFDLDGGAKDLRTMLAEAKLHGVELPVIERTLSCFEEAVKNGHGKQDNSSLPVYWARRGQK
jgi:3-hydroxyisobutyrate dehydrogenase